jgi:hypothetical protein
MSLSRTAVLSLRSEFPALKNTLNGHSIIFSIVLGEPKSTNP